VVAAVGFWDDHGHVPARWRLLAHLVAACAALYAVGGLDILVLNGRTIAIGWAGNLAGILFITWMLNLVNFMDGIDGIAGSEVLFVSAGAAALSWWLYPGTSTFLVYALLAVAAAGFLLWNWPPAKIFMGDVGSGFLGFLLGAFALSSAAQSGLSLVVWLILAGVFVVDASYTLLFRAAAGQRWYEAHRTHAYQKATAVLAGHRRVTQAVLLINLLWLLPLACAAAFWPARELGLLIIAYVPLLLLAYRLGAGKAG
jgi:Fuc2NAc and GlcNAc transferase